MISKTTARFRELLALLPENIRERARKAYELFAGDPQHPSLRFKKVHPTEPVYSARINREYRAIGLLEDEVIVWFWIGTHGDYDKLLEQL